MDMLDVSRRRFFQIAGAGTLAALTGCVNESIRKRDRNGVNPFNLVRLFYCYGVCPVVQDTCGDKTLIQIGEEHLGYGDEYVRFFRNLEGRIDFDSIFMENVYANYHFPDSCTALNLDNAVIAGKEFCVEEFRRKDRTGYLRLSERYKARGIEEDNRDTQILWTMLETSFFGLYPLTGEYKNGKSPIGEITMNTLASKLKKSKFAQRVYPERDDKINVEKLRCEIKKELANAVYPTRNEHFAEFIDRNLNQYEVGALIIGRGHIFPSETEGAEILQRYFRDRKINAILLDVEQVKEFNKKNT